MEAEFPGLHVHAELDGTGELVTTVIGELDAHTAPRFVARLRDAPVPSDVVDLRFVSFISAAGINALLEARRSHPFRIIGSDVFERLVRICNLGETLAADPATGPPCLQRASFGVAVHDSSLRYTYVNDALADINGVAASSHPGRRPSDMWAIVTDEITPILRDVLRTGNERHTLVAGTTAASTGAVWRCSYRRVRDRRGDAFVIAVVETVESDPNAPSMSSSPRVEFSGAVDDVS